MEHSSLIKVLKAISNGIAFFALAVIATLAWKIGSEIGDLRKEVSDLKVKVSKLKTEPAIHNEGSLKVDGDIKIESK